MVAPTAPRGIGVLALDLDGTVLTDGHGISDRTVAAVAAFRASGRDVVVATGRSSRSALPWASRLGGAKAMVCHNGAAVYDCPGFPEGRLLSEAVLPEALVRRVIGLSRELGLHFHGFGGDDWYYERARPGTAIYERRSGFAGALVDFDELREPRFNKAMFVSSPGREIEAAAEAARALCGGEATVMFTSPGFLEIVPLGATKAAGLTTWLSSRGLALADAMAIGDADNDLEMIRGAGYGVAMADAPEEVRAAAAFVTGGIADDGAAAAIELFLAAPESPPRSRPFKWE